MDLEQISLNNNPDSDLPVWLEIAFRELGVASYPTGASNPRIELYNLGTSIEGHDDKAPWCSTFIHWSLAQAGVAGTASAVARSWLSWGKELNNPVKGCIAVLWREDPDSWKGHVGFYLREDEEFVYLLGGNQLDRVQEHFYPKDSVLSYRWPAE